MEILRSTPGNRRASAGTQNLCPQRRSFPGSLALKKRVKRLTSEYERVLTDLLLVFCRLEQRIVNAPTGGPFQCVVNFLLSFREQIRDSATSARVYNEL